MKVSINPSAGTPRKSSNDSMMGGVSRAGGALLRPLKVTALKEKLKSLLLLFSLK